MTTAPIAFRSNPGQYAFLGPTQLLNSYAEKQGADAKGPMAVLPCEGLVEFTDTGAGPCRGLVFMEDLEKAYSVHSSSVYRHTYDGTTVTTTRIGTVPGVDPTQLSRNQKADPQLVIRSNSGVQVLESDSVAYITDDDLPDEVVTAEFVSGYHAYGEDNCRFTLSGLNSAKVIDALDFATFEQKAGKLLRIKENSGEMFGFCSTWMEVWRNVNDADFPFSPIAFKPRGLKAAHAVVECDNTLMFPGDDNNIHRLENYSPVIISTNEIARLIQEDASPEDMLGFGWTRGGHSFANFSGTDWSRCYDAATKVWHTRESYGQTKWRARHSMAAWNKSIVGDSLSGKLFYLAKDTFTEDGGTMIWGVDSPPLHVFPNGGILDAVHLDLGTGYGTLSGQGSDPKMMFSVSKDGGNTFGSYRELELGVRGKYATRVTARSLGEFGPKGAVLRLRISDPVVRALVNCDVEVRPLKK